MELQLLCIFVALSKASAFLFWFQQIDTIQEKVVIVENVSEIRNVSECSRECIANRNSDCTGIRFEDNHCQLVNYDAGRDFKPGGLFPPGNMSVLWRMQYSPDYCFVNFKGRGNYEQVKEFCGRFGGRIPEVRSVEDMDRMAEAVQRCPIELQEDPDEPGRWSYPSDGTQAPAELSPPPGEGDPDHKCARWIFEGLKVHKIIRWNCMSRIGFLCYICG